MIKSNLFSSLKTKDDCNGATIPEWRDANDNEIPSCRWKEHSDNPYGGTCYNIIYPSAIHTTGSTNREAGEVGGEWYLDIGTEEIDKTHQLAKDRYDSKGKINYDPIGFADSLPRKEREDDTTNKFDEIQLKDHPGPWRYVPEN